MSQRNSTPQHNTTQHNVMLQEIRKFNDNFDKLEAELVVNKRVKEL